ncbi:MAG TPA: hypothetical protein VFA74_07175 [Terriglobales bacterium]|nr:hypothetical protein [Terriglobales bacterium]
MNSELETKLAQLASQRGRDSEALVVEAIERMVSYDQWFMRAKWRRGYPQQTVASLLNTKALRNC